MPSNKVRTRFTLRNDPGHRILIQYNCGIGGYPRIIYI